MTIRNDRLAWKDRFHSGCNRLDFALRNFLASPGGPGGKLPEAVLETARLESLTMLDWLRFAHQQASEAFTPALTLECDGMPLCWLDVGAKNWAYAAGLATFLKEALPEGAFACIDGVEIDPNRRTTDLRTRRQTAEALISRITAGSALVEPALSTEAGNNRRQNVQLAYHAGDVLDWQTSAHIITHFLPFVAIDPLLAWGLPSEHFKPQAILAHLLDRLLPGGLLLVVNQGEAEAALQEALFVEASQARPLRIVSLGELPCNHITYRYPRYGWICTHD